MENYPQEEDPGSCIVKLFSFGAMVLVSIPVVALLAWFVLKQMG